MIVENTRYFIQCDRCEEPFSEDNGNVKYYDIYLQDYPKDIPSEAKEKGWIFFEGKHYCPECYEKVYGNLTVKEPILPSALYLKSFFRRYHKNPPRIEETDDFIYFYYPYCSKKITKDDIEYLKRFFGEKLSTIKVNKNETVITEEMYEVTVKMWKSC